MPDARAEGPLAGIRVLEVANWLAAPAGCALLADAGADVIKVETPGGEPYRAYRGGGGVELPYNPFFELDNRGKRAITLNLDNPAARGIIYRLIGESDVFVTNLLAKRRERYGLTYEELKKHRPDLIFVSVTGYGSWGPDRDRAGLRLRRLLGALRHHEPAGRAGQPSASTAARHGRPHDGAGGRRRRLDGAL